VKEEKAKIRIKVKTLIAGVNRIEASKKITQKLEEFMPNKGFVLGFEPLSDEPDISTLIDKLKEEKRLVLVCGERSNPILVSDVKDISLALIPGRAFNKKGVRLGRGGGTFDRILSKIKCLKIGVAFNVQILDELPKESHDQPVDIIVTEKEIIKCNIDFSGK